MVWIDSAYLERMLALLDYLAVLGDVCNLGVGVVYSFQKFILVVHGLDGIFYVLKVVLVVWVRLDQFDDLFALLDGDCQSKFE